MLRHAIFGLGTYVPGFKKLFPHRTGGTNNASYCYSVWLRHLSYLSKFREVESLKTVAELGPGDSLGIGLAALLTGAEKYIGLDVAPYANSQENLAIFDELVGMFLSQCNIPGNDLFPRIKPKLENYSYPETVLTKKILFKSLKRERLDFIRWSIKNINHPQSLIHYVAPWSNPKEIRVGELDLIFSQAVLEHVDKLEEAYNAMSSWLKTEGLMSHQIDFKSHGLTQEWNGHWTFSQMQWSIIRGKRDYLLNRQPFGVHKNLINKNGFKILFSQRADAENKIPIKKLAPQYHLLNQEDLSTSGAYLVAKKITT